MANLNMNSSIEKITLLRDVYFKSVLSQYSTKNNDDLFYALEDNFRDNTFKYFLNYSLHRLATSGMLPSRIKNHINLHKLTIGNILIPKLTESIIIEVLSHYEKYTAPLKKELINELYPVIYSYVDGFIELHKLYFQLSTESLRKSLYKYTRQYIFSPYWTEHAILEDIKHISIKLNNELSNINPLSKSTYITSRFDNELLASLIGEISHAKKLFSLIPDPCSDCYSWRKNKTQIIDYCIDVLSKHKWAIEIKKPSRECDFIATRDQRKIIFKIFNTSPNSLTTENKLKEITSTRLNYNVEYCYITPSPTPENILEKFNNKNTQIIHHSETYPTYA